MSFFDQLRQFDADRADDFDEDVQYLATGQQTPVSLRARVKRSPPDVPAEVATDVLFHATVFIPAGRGVAQVDPSGDAIYYPTNVGETPSWHAVAQIVTQSPAGWLLLVR